MEDLDRSMDFEHTISIIQQPQSLHFQQNFDLVQETPQDPLPTDEGLPKVQAPASRMEEFEKRDEVDVASSKSQTRQPSSD